MFGGMDVREVTVATALDARPPLDEEAVLLFASLERFGGRMREARRRAYAVGEVSAATERRLGDLGVEVRVREPVIERFRMANKLRMFDPAENDGTTVLVALDSDVVVAGDFSEYLDAEVVQARQVDGDHLTFALWRRIAGLFGMEVPALRLPTTLAPGRWTHAYFNGGVILAPGALLADVHARWLRFIEEILERRAELADVVEHMRGRVPAYHDAAADPELRPLIFAEQWAFSLAVQDLGAPFAVLPLAMNFPVAYRDEDVRGRYLRDRFAPHGVAPLLLHHHHSANAGALPRTGYREPDRVIREVNVFLRGRRAARAPAEVG